VQLTVLGSDPSQIGDGEFARRLVKLAHPSGDEPLCSESDELVSFVAELRIVPGDVVRHLMEKQRKSRHVRSAIMSKLGEAHKKT
jgi:hypothetical protein